MEENHLEAEAQHEQALDRSGPKPQVDDRRASRERGRLRPRGALGAAMTSVEA